MSEYSVMTKIIYLFYWKIRQTPNDVRLQWHYSVDQWSVLLDTIRVPCVYWVYSRVYRSVDENPFVFARVPSPVLIVKKPSCAADCRWQKQSPMTTVCCCNYTIVEIVYHRSGMLSNRIEEYNSVAENRASRAKWMKYNRKSSGNSSFKTRIMNGMSYNRLYIAVGLL